MKSRHLVLPSSIILVLILINVRYPVGITTTSSDIAPSSALSADHGCTSFCLNNAGHSVFGANLDESYDEGYLYVNQRHVSKTGLEPNAAGEYASWTSRYGSLTFNLVGYELAWAGMNEAGLMISTMYLPGTQVPDVDERPPMESPFWLQYQLDNFGSIQEVIASNSQIRIAPGARDHYLICDASGNCATVELLEGKMVYHTGETLPVAALTNTVYVDSVKAWHAGSAPSSDFSSLKRFGVAADRVTSFSATSSEGAVQYAFDTLLQARNPGLTAWSIVFDAQNRRVYFRTKRNEEIRYVDFNKLDFSCDGPVQTQNIQAELSGDVSDDFVPYSHELSFAHSKRAFAYFELSIPDDWLVKLLDHLENFPCMKDNQVITQETPLVQAEKAVAQETPLLKVEEVITQATPLGKVEKAVAQETPRSLFPIGWLASAALLAIVLLLIGYRIRQRK